MNKAGAGSTGSQIPDEKVMAERVGFELHPVLITKESPLESDAIEARNAGNVTT